MPSNQINTKGKARIPKAANWAIGAFLLGSAVRFETCQADRRRERAAVARAVEIIDRKQAEKKERERAAREAARKRREEQEEVEARRNSARWYQFS